MDGTTQSETVAETADRNEPIEPSTTKAEKQAEDAVEKPKKKGTCKHASHKQKAKRRQKARDQKASKHDTSADSDSSTDTDEGDSDADTSSSEDDKKTTRAKKRKHSSKKVKSKSKSKRKRKVVDTFESDDIASSSDSDAESTEEETPKKKRKAKKSRKADGDFVSSSDDSESEAEGDSDDLQTQMEALKLKIAAQQKLDKIKKKHGRKTSKSSTKGKRKSSKAGAPGFKRVDQLWDSTIHNYKLKESAEDDDSEFSEFVFLVRRKFDWENKYLSTVVDVKSKLLRAALTDVMKDCKSISLETEEPTIDPNTLFLYLEELRKYYKKTLQVKIKSEKKRKAIKKLETQRKQVKTLVKYIDEDYAETKKTLYPLLQAGNITFELLWALFHPNDIAVTSTYGAWDEPRCFKVDYTNKYSSMTRGEWYCVEGKYLEYDGKNHGMGDFEADIEGFKGPRKITSLATYPLKYHQEQEKVKKLMIERGKCFIALENMEYKFHKGMAFMKKKKIVAKININGRVMVDPATFRRINPNYPISFIKPKESEELFGDTDGEDSECSCSDSSDSEAGNAGREALDSKEDDDKVRTKYKVVKDEHNKPRLVKVEVDADGEPVRNQQVDQSRLEHGHDVEQKEREFTEEELLLASPVVLGFAFSEKLWVEFTLSGVHPITYNEDAFESLVLPPNQKSIVKALVESHKFHAAKTIDDVVQGKGKGLVAVLHGPPGTGKTLTAEGISELLKCPLYMVSAGELGTDPARLEHELQKILDIAHSWGAVLLLDEADVFLEKREVHDIHRNALVSIFLRLLEYFQGILFLTTNRVETFDDAFQSRIHVALRYGELTTKAKRAVWKMFLDMVRKMDGAEASSFSEEDYDTLARHSLNGRQIKNNVRTAQALAVNENEKLTMMHIKRVLEVAEAFDHDLKGGSGYADAMRSYT